jgi:hypothetical protein
MTAVDVSGEHIVDDQQILPEEDSGDFENKDKQKILNRILNSVDWNVGTDSVISQAEKCVETMFFDPEDKKRAKEVIFDLKKVLEALINQYTTALTQSWKDKDFNKINSQLSLIVGDIGELSIDFSIFKDSGETAAFISHNIRPRFLIERFLFFKDVAEPYIMDNFNINNESENTTEDNTSNAGTEHQSDNEFLDGDQKQDDHKDTSIGRVFLEEMKSDFLNMALDNDEIEFIGFIFGIEGLSSNYGKWVKKDKFSVEQGKQIEETSIDRGVGGESGQLKLLLEEITNELGADESINLFGFSHSDISQMTADEFVEKIKIDGNGFITKIKEMFGRTSLEDNIFNGVKKWLIEKSHADSLDKNRWDNNLVVDGLTQEAINKIIELYSDLINN